MDYKRTFFVSNVKRWRGRRVIRRLTFNQTSSLIDIRVYYTLTKLMSH